MTAQPLNASDVCPTGAEAVYARPARLALAIALEPSQRVLIGDGLVVNVDGRRQLNLALGRVVEVSDSVSEREVEDVPAASPGVACEMQVPPDHLSMPSSASGKPNPTIVPGTSCRSLMRCWASASASCVYGRLCLGTERTRTCSKRPSIRTATGRIVPSSRCPTAFPRAAYCNGPRRVTGGPGEN